MTLAPSNLRDGALIAYGRPAAALADDTWWASRRPWRDWSRDL